MYRSEANAYRKKIEEAANLLPDGEALESINLFAEWQANTEYTVGDRRRYGGTLYRCIQAHRSLDDWEPGAAVSLWTRVADPAEEWPEWIPPEGAHNAYRVGAKVSHNGKHWINNTPANVYEPGVYGWDEA